MNLPSTKNFAVIAALAGGIALSVTACDGGHYHGHTVVHHRTVVHQHYHYRPASRPGVRSRTVVVGRRR